MAQPSPAPSSTSAAHNSHDAQDIHWMRHALLQAHTAAAAAEVPVGAVVVRNGQVIASAHNTTQGGADPCGHAEILALRSAAQTLGTARLDGCTLYVTLEPCTMCAGAALNARLDRVVWGAAEPKTGAAGSVHNVFALPAINHRTKVTGGVLAASSAGILQNFFLKRRQAQREAARAAHPLPDFALRLPASTLDEAPHWPEPQWRSDLPAARRLRLAVVDTAATFSDDSPPQAATGDEGPLTLLCVHGHADWSHVFAPLLQHWQPQCDAGHVRIVAPDLAGCGRSDQPKKAELHTADWHASMLAQWITALDLRRVVIVGLGDGAALALMAVQKLGLQADRCIGAWLHNAWPAMAHLPPPAPWLQWHAQAARKSTWPVGQRQAQWHGWTSQTHAMPEHPRQQLDAFIPEALDALIAHTSAMPIASASAAAPASTAALARASEMPFDDNHGGTRAILQAWPTLHQQLTPAPVALLQGWMRQQRLWITLDAANAQLPAPLWQQAWQTALGRSISAAELSGVLHMRTAAA